MNHGRMSSSPLPLKTGVVLPDAPQSLMPIEMTTTTEDEASQKLRLRPHLTILPPQFGLLSFLQQKSFCVFVWSFVCLKNRFVHLVRQNKEIWREERKTKTETHRHVYIERWRQLWANRQRNEQPKIRNIEIALPERRSALLILDFKTLVNQTATALTSFSNVQFSPVFFFFDAIFSTILRSRKSAQKRKRPINQERIRSVSSRSSVPEIKTN